MLAELGTEKGKQAASLGGGGSKAQEERAAALAAILDARSRIKDDSKSNGKTENRQVFSIVDAASASVHGRSAAAAKAGSAEKTAARIASHMAGERAPVNSKLVGFIPLSLIRCLVCCFYHICYVSLSSWLCNSTMSIVICCYSVL